MGEEAELRTKVTGSFADNSGSSAESTTDGSLSRVVDHQPPVTTVSAVEGIGLGEEKGKKANNSFLQPCENESVENELLSYENVLESFQATSSDLNSGELYPCQGCNDVFSLASSLKDHLQRKTMLIQMHCPSCMHKRSFFNKCLAYRHMRAHYGDSIPKLQAIVKNSSILLLPKTYTMLPRSISEELQSLDSSLLGMLKSPTDNTTSLSPANTEGGDMGCQAELSRAGSYASASMPPLDCTECGLKFSDLGELQAHFGKPQKGVAVTLRHACASCDKALFSACALRAHARMHAHRRPFVCPECACVVPGDLSVFEKHVCLKCHHRARSLEYSCGVCTNTFESLLLLQQHWLHLPAHCLMAHFDTLYKCAACPMAFKTEELFAGHTCAAVKAACGTLPVLVFVCRGCEKVFRSYDELVLHNGVEHRHRDLGQRRPAAACYMFRCEACGAKHKSLPAYAAHLLKEHGCHVVTEMCDVCGEEFKTSEQLSQHLFSAHGTKAGVICAKDVILGKAGSTDSQLANGTCSNADSTFSQLAVNEKASNDQLAVQEKEVGVPAPVKQPSVKVEIKSTASVKHSNSAPAPVKAQEPPVSEEQLFNCHLCGMHFDAYALLKHHMSSIHHGLGHLYVCWICNDRSTTHKNFNSPALLDKHLLDVHKIDVNPSAVSSLDRGDGDSPKDGRLPLPAPKKLKLDGEDAVFQCSKCDFRSRSRVDFGEHILMHRTVGECAQCAECGMCFSVQPALRRHLYVVHRVRDFSSYAREYGTPHKGGGEAPSLIGSTSGLGGNDGQCPVCSRRFDSEAALRNHTRTHGMAFISAKRSQGSNGKSGSEDDSNDLVGQIAASLFAAS